jgi:RNA polymerase sigma-70 factor (ECF subfamily)
MAVHAHPAEQRVLMPGPGQRAAHPAAPTESDREESALLMAIGRGDRDRALPELYRRYERRLFGLGIRLLGDGGLAEELVQETFLRVWRTAGRFDESRGTAAAFILSIARHLAIDLWRRPSSRPLQPEPEAIAAIDETIDRLLLQLAVREALDTLPATQRQVLELSYHSDLTQTEVAERLGIPVGTVKSRAYHALRAFRRAADERGIHG